MSKLVIKVRSSKKMVTIKSMKFNAQSHTVYDIKKAYCDEHDNTNEPETIVFRVKGKELRPNNATLVSAGIKATAKFVMVSMSTRLCGGAQYVPNGNILNSNKIRKLNKSDPEIKLSNKACCVYLDKTGDRAEMPCGHAFSPQSMFATLRGLLCKNDYEYDIKCPACNSILDFDLCAKIADLSDNEYIYFLEEIEKRSSPECQPCPDCGKDCERPDNLTMLRVNCTGCSGGDWCFICAQKWRGGGFTVCGNQNCELYDINSILQECPMKEATNGVKVPELRSCPGCLEFIEHKEACKHMHCNKCGHDFCFSCLKPKLNGKWQCGSYMDPCIAAPRQKF